MAFVSWAPNNPGYTYRELTARADVGYHDPTDAPKKAVYWDRILRADLQVLYSPAVNTSGIVKPYSGWITYGSGGGGDPGGGSTRPTTGMLYPRGQG